MTGGYEEGTLLDATFRRIGPGYKASHNGRIKFGTESNGGFRNVTVSNCVIEDCRGIALESVDGALLEDISISNITMRDIVDVPLFLRLGSRMRGPEGTPVGELRRVNISDIIVSNCASRQASLIIGIPGHYIEDVKLSNTSCFTRAAEQSKTPRPSRSKMKMAIPSQTDSVPCPPTASIFAT